MKSKPRSCRLSESTMTSKPIKVILTPSELTMAAACGCQRNIEAIRKKLKPAYGFAEEYSWNIHIEGACGEVAAARVLSLFWSPTVNTFSAPDISHNIQIRTRSSHTYDLIVRRKDNPNNLYVHVTGKAPEFLIHGYILGAKARRDEWEQRYGGRPPAWFVPRTALKAIDGLMP